MALRDYPSQADYGRIGYVVHSIPDNPDHYTLIRDCPFCHTEARVVVPAQGLWDWEHGKFVQRAMASLSDHDREIVLTGTHPECWDRMMTEEDE